MINNLFQEIYSYGNQCAAITDEQSITYNDLAKTSEMIRSIMPGRNLIFHIGANSLGALAGYTAFMNNNQVPLILSDDIAEDTLNELIEVYRPRYLFLPIAGLEKFPGCQAVVQVYDYVLIDSVYTDDRPALHPDLALLLTTSGSTGSSKYVRLSYRNIRSNAEAIVNCLSLTAAERPVTILPMCYTYGLSVINSHLLVGATLLVTKKKIIQPEFWDFLIQNAATSISGTAYTYQVFKRIGLMKMDLPSLKSLTQSGGKLSEELHLQLAQYADETGRKFYAMYGQTEATARITCLPYDKAGEKCGSIGLPVSGVKLRLVGNVERKALSTIDFECGTAADGNNYENEVVGAGIEGEIVCCGSGISMGYADTAADLEKGDERKGILYTGDIGRRDKDGFYYIVGRKSRIIKMYGNRVNLDEVETMVKNKFPEMECGCCGVDDRLVVYVNEKEPELQERIKLFISQKTKINIMGITIRFIVRLPVDGAGKTMYKKLENM